MPFDRLYFFRAEQALEFQVLPDPLDRFTGCCRLTPECTVDFRKAGDAEQARARQAGASAS
mgnify:CR=1 FL=1